MSDEEMMELTIYRVAAEMGLRLSSADASELAKVLIKYVEAKETA